MVQFLGVFRHVFNMSIRRKGLWVAYLLLAVFFGITLFTPSPGGDVLDIPDSEAWTYAGQIVFMFNMLMPLAGGILAADRIQRDYQLNIRELQNSTPISHANYVFGKYFGVLFSVLVPMLLWVVVASFLAVALAQTSFGFLGAMLIAFVSISIPACAFVIAFSLACPLIMPVRVYQILLTGYWFWANYLNHETFPTLNGTLVTPGGRYVLEAFFGSFMDTTDISRYSPLEALVNLLVIGLCIALVIFVLRRYLVWQTQQL